MITLARLKEVLRYDSETGQFWWRITLSNRAVVGNVAGWVDAYGHVNICIDGKIYKAHRLAWLYMTERRPPKIMDHRNRIADDNRWLNLRRATKSQNAANSRIENRASYHGASGLWRARVMIRGKEKVKHFKTETEAIKARAIMRRETFGEFSP